MESGAWLFEPLLSCSCSVVVEFVAPVTPEAVEGKRRCAWATPTTGMPAQVYLSGTLQQASSYLDPLLPPLPPGARRRWSSKGNKTRCGEPKSTGKQIQCGDDTQFGGG
ncbi:uncharacterized protein [Miscanthus floridulus]|uniref:uncharacterized protein isoform X1 n=1 Tax=Miscanthus floridulus TaxID=154761 RepID=UPI003457FDA4